MAYWPRSLRGPNLNLRETPDDARPRTAPAPVDALGAVLLGACTGLLFTAMPRGVLLPALDRMLPWSLGLVTLAGLFGLGLAAANTVSRNRRRLLMVVVACFAGGLLAAELADWMRPALVGWVLGSAPFHVLVLLTCGAVALPLALPLGALTGLALGAGGRSTVWLLLGAAAGFATAPFLCEVLLGWSVSLRCTGLLGAAGGACLFGNLPRPSTAARLVPGGGLALALFGAALLAVTLQLRDGLALGSLGGPWLVAGACSGAAVTCALVGRRARNGRPPRLHLPLLAVACVLALPLLQALQPAVWADTARGPRDGLGLVLLLGPAAGVLPGLLIARRGGRAGLNLAWLPLLLVLLAPLTVRLLLPTWDLRGTSWVLAALGVAGLWAGRGLARPGTREGLIVVAVLAALSLAGVGRPVPAGAVPARVAWQTADGPVAVLDDPATGRPRLAPGDLADLGVPDLQRRRRVHLPLLLHRLTDPLGDSENPDTEAARGDHTPRSLLLSASSHGEEVRAALAHELTSIVWNEPTSDRTAVIDTTDAAALGRDVYLSRTSGSERLLLLGRDDSYDVILLAPDPLMARRAAQVGTVEFYTAARMRLAPGGIFCQWWDLFRTDVSDVKAMVAGAAEVFEYVYLALDHPRSRRAGVAVIGSSWPLQVDLERLEQYLATHPAVHADLEAVGLDGQMLASLVMADRGMLELLAPDIDALHDRRPTLGVRGPWRKLVHGFHPEDVHATLTMRRRNPMPWIEPGAELDDPARRALVEERVNDILQGWQQLIGGASAVVAEYGVGAPAFELEAPGEGPEVEAEAFLSALPLLHDWPYLDGLVLGFANRLQQEGRDADAERYLRRAIAAKDWSAPFRFALAQVVERNGDLDDARILYGTVIAFDAEHAGARAALTRLSTSH